jgi:ankyrin repeat protein
MLLLGINDSPSDDGPAVSGAGAADEISIELHEQLRTGVTDNDLDAVTRALLSGPVACSVDQLDAEGCSCLHLACVHGFEKVTKLLIDLGAKVNVLSTQADTPLHYATFARHLDIVKLLLAHGADPTMQNHDGVSSMDVASEPRLKEMLTAASTNRKRSNGGAAACEDDDSCSDDETIKISRSTPEKRARKGSGRAPKTTARGRGRGGRRRTRQPKSTKAQQSMIQNAAVVPAAVQQLHEAIKQGDIEMVQSEISLGTPLDAPDALGRFSLHVCAQYNQIKIARLVLDAGVDVDSVGPRRSTPLHLAAEAGHHDMVAVLLEYNADSQCINDLGHTPAAVAMDPDIKLMLLGEYIALPLSLRCFKSLTNESLFHRRCCTQERHRSFQGKEIKQHER